MFANMQALSWDDALAHNNDVLPPFEDMCDMQVVATLDGGTMLVMEGDVLPLDSQSNPEQRGVLHQDSGSAPEASGEPGSSQAVDDAQISAMDEDQRYPEVERFSVGHKTQLWEPRFTAQIALFLFPTLFSTSGKGSM